MGDSLNCVLITGNLGKDPDLRYTGTGRAVCNFSIAVSESYKKDEKWHENTTWINCIVWGKLGEKCGQNLLKGHKVFIQGKLQTSSWDDKNTGQKRYKTEVVAAKVEHFAGVPTSNGGGGDAPTTPGPMTDDDIPFVIWGDHRHDQQMQA